MNIIIDEEFKSLIPPLTQDEYTGLEESILMDGCRDALILWGNILVDGHNRFEICKKHNVLFNTVQRDFNNREEAIIWIIDNQRGRRNLQAIDRTLLELKKKDALDKLGRKKKSDAVTRANRARSNPSSIQMDKTEPAINTQAEIAKSAGVGSGTVARVEQIIKKAPQLIDSIRSGDISINQAYNKIKADEKEKRKEKEQRKQFELDDQIPEDAFTLFCDDIRNGLYRIDDNSVDFIITDPPYPKEYLSLYSELSKVASRVLKPGGSLIVMVGQSYLPEVINRLSENMTYHWCMTYMTPGGQSPQLFHKKVNTFWKPVLWFTKDNYDGDWVGDVLKSPVNANDKRFHEWGQSLGGMIDIVERFTDPEDIILDPFLGGGTTGVAAVTMKRKFIGCDIEQKNIDVSDERIKEAYAECLK